MPRPSLVWATIVRRTVDPSDIRRTAIVAMFSDDVLMDLLVLKGGNALDLAHGISARGSLDLDFSIAADLPDVDDVRQRLFRALRDRFNSVDLYVFDERFSPRPDTSEARAPEWWGGYLAEFKVIDLAIAEALEFSLDQLRKRSAEVGLSGKRVFRIEISKFEYCDFKMSTELDDYKIYVYTPAMIAAEKLRAICQQMPAYEYVAHQRARARDFFDIHALVTRADVDLTTPANRELLTSVFAAKHVPLNLLEAVGDFREFHRADWVSVEDALTETAASYDLYFDFVLAQISRLETFWNV